MNDLRSDELRQVLLLKLLEGQRKTSDPTTIMLAASQEIGEFLRVDRVGFFERDEESLYFKAGWTSGRLPLLDDKLPASDFGSLYLQELRAGKTVGISDTRIDPLTADSSLAEIGTISLIGVPIIRNGKWHAGFCVMHAESRSWTTREIDMVRAVGEQTWDGVERAHTEAELRRQWRLFDTALANTPDFTYIFDLDGRSAMLIARCLSSGRSPSKRRSGGTSSSSNIRRNSPRGYNAKFVE